MASDGLHNAIALLCVKFVPTFPMPLLLLICLSSVFSLLEYWLNPSPTARSASPFTSFRSLYIYWFIVSCYFVVSGILGVSIQCLFGYLFSFPCGYGNGHSSFFFFDGRWRRTTSNLIVERLRWLLDLLANLFPSSGPVVLSTKLIVLNPMLYIPCIIFPRSPSFPQSLYNLFQDRTPRTIPTDIINRTPYLFLVSWALVSVAALHLGLRRNENICLSHYFFWLSGIREYVLNYSEGLWVFLFSKTRLRHLKCRDKWILQHGETMNLTIVDVHKKERSTLIKPYNWHEGGTGGMLYFT